MITTMQLCASSICLRKVRLPENHRDFEFSLLRTDKVFICYSNQIMSSYITGAVYSYRWKVLTCCQYCAKINSFVAWFRNRITEGFLNFSNEWLAFIDNVFKFLLFHNRTKYFRIRIKTFRIIAKSIVINLLKATLMQIWNFVNTSAFISK